VITPAYSPTATERVLPRMALDFTTAALDPRVTVTRALNTATRINSSGLVQLVNADLPRFDFDPITKACKGLLIEESRINIQVQSEDFSTTWVATGISVSTNSTTAPDGNATADTLTASASPGNIVHLQAVGNGTTYAFSLFVKKLTSDTVQINFSNVAAGPVFTFSTETFSTVASWTTSFQKLDNGWYRITATRASNTTFAGMQIRIANSGEAIYAWGAQMEAGAFATSYIPTTTTSLTRNNDIVSMTGANFSDWYNASGGSFVFEGSALSTLGFAYLVLASDNTNTNRFGAYKSGAAVSGLVTSSGGTQMEITGSPIVANVPFKMAVAAQANSGNFSFNGSIGTNDTTIVMPTVSQLTIGSFQNLSPLNGHARAVRYYLPRLINAELQAFSK